MKIGLYADAHFSSTSSILPNSSSEGKYTTRLDMLVNSFEWMYNKFNGEGIKLIINLGDLFDSHIVKAIEQTALSEALSYSKGTPELHLLGNHDILDVNSKYYSTALLDNFNFITVANKPRTIHISNDTDLHLLPYTMSDNVTSESFKGVDKNKKNILCSHIDIIGSYLRPEYVMPTGVDSDMLSRYFDLTLNGHLHTAETLPTTKNVVMNMGSIVGGSFNDSHNYIPSICVLDTDTLKITRFNNPHAVLFRKVKCNSCKDLITSINKLNKDYSYALRVTVPIDIRLKCKEILDNFTNLVTYRLISDFSGAVLPKSEEITHIESNFDITDKFIEFIADESTNLKYNKQDYSKIVEEVNKCI